MQVQRVENNNLQVNFKGNVVDNRELRYAIHQAKSVKELLRFKNAVENANKVKDGKEFWLEEIKRNTYLFMHDGTATYRLDEKFKGKKSSYSNVLNRFSKYLEKVYPKKEVGREELEKDIVHSTVDRGLL